jgi:5'-nucleotidase / UDP-sugar diphosphatase
LISSQPNILKIRPAGCSDAFLLVGDATSGPITIDDTALPARSYRRDQRLILRVLHINDLHGLITRPTSRGDEPVLSRLVSHVGSVRESVAAREDAALLFLSAGDDIGGSVFDSLVDENASDQVHPVFTLLADIGLNATAIGNHDLDFGEEVLIRAANQGRYPLLSANLTGSDQLADAVFPAAIFVFNGIRVGLIGLITPERLKHRNGETWSVADPMETLANLLPALRPLCDSLIILSHLGYRGNSGVNGKSFCDYHLAQSVPPGCVDLIIGGHSHDPLNEQCLDPANIVNGIPIPQSGALGRYIGDATLIVRTANHRSKATVTNAHLIHTSDLPVDESFDHERLTPLLTEVRPFLDRIIGRIDPDPSLMMEFVRQNFDAGELALANFITDALHDRCHENGLIVDVAMIDASVVRAGLPAREHLTIEDWYRTMPFADSIQCYRVTGRQLLDLLYDNVFRPGRWDEPSIERGFAHFSRQIRYAVVLGETRAENLLFNPLIRGVALNDRLNHRFLLATHSHFRASAASWERFHWPPGIPMVGFDRWPGEDTGLSLREECLHYIHQHGGVTRKSGAKTDGRMRVIEPGFDYEYRHVFHQSPFPRPGNGGRAEAPAEHSHWSW